MTPESTLAWWCPSRDRLSRAPPRAGVVEHHSGELDVGRAGLHASPTVVDALAFGETPIACRVELDGEVRRGVGQLCGRTRRVRWLADARAAIPRVVSSETERLFAIASRNPAARASTWARVAAPSAVAGDGAIDRAREESAQCDRRFRDVEWRAGGKPTDELATARHAADLAHAAVALAEARGFDSPTLLDLSRPLERLADAIAWVERGDGGFDSARGRARAILTGALALALERDKVDALSRDVLEELGRERSTPEAAVPSPKPWIFRLEEPLPAFVLSTPGIALPPSALSSAPAPAVARGVPPPAAPKRLADDESTRPRWAVFCIECTGRFGRDDRPFYVSEPCPGCFKAGWLVELDD